MWDMIGAGWEHAGYNDDDYDETDDDGYGNDLSKWIIPVVFAVTVAPLIICFGCVLYFKVMEKHYQGGRAMVHPAPVMLAEEEPPPPRYIPPVNRPTPIVVTETTPSELPPSYTETAL
eukprot:gene1829-6263_t